MAIRSPIIQDPPNPWAFLLIDGAYFIKRFRTIEPHNAHNADRAAAKELHSPVTKRTVDFAVSDVNFGRPPMWRTIPKSLMAQIDGLRSTCHKQTGI